MQPVQGWVNFEFLGLFDQKPRQVRDGWVDVICFAVVILHCICPLCQVQVTLLCFFLVEEFFCHKKIEKRTQQKVWELLAFSEYLAIITILPVNAIPVERKVVRIKSRSDDGPQLSDARLARVWSADMKIIRHLSLFPNSVKNPRQRGQHFDRFLNIHNNIGALVIKP